jgi:hypothetical protein
METPLIIAEESVDERERYGRWQHFSDIYSFLGRRKDVRNPNILVY